MTTVPFTKKKEEISFWCHTFWQIKSPVRFRRTLPPSLPPLFPTFLLFHLKWTRSKSLRFPREIQVARSTPLSLE